MPYAAAPCTTLDEKARIVLKLTLTFVTGTNAPSHAVSTVANGLRQCVADLSGIILSLGLLLVIAQVEAGPN